MHIQSPTIWCFDLDLLRSIELKVGNNLLTKQKSVILPQLTKIDIDVGHSEISCALLRYE